MRVAGTVSDAKGALVLDTVSLAAMTGKDRARLERCRFGVTADRTFLRAGPEDCAKVRMWRLRRRAQLLAMLETHAWLWRARPVMDVSDASCERGGDLCVAAAGEVPVCISGKSPQCVGSPQPVIVSDGRMLGSVITDLVHTRAGSRMWRPCL